MKKITRFFAVAATAVLSVSSLVMFAGCSTSTPEVTITFTFNGSDYAVDFTLARKGAPQTVQHFIELADAGYYNGMVVHDYQASGRIHAGGYTLNNGELEEKDYWTEVKALEAKGKKFTQSVFTNDDAQEGLYTVYGEFKNNGVEKNDESLKQNQRGTLVMDYMNKGKDNTQVKVTRSDGGKNNEGEKIQTSEYKYNSATSMFYITLNASGTDRDDDYCAFGRVQNYSQIQALLEAIGEFEDTLSDDQNFTEVVTKELNQHDPFPLVQSGKISAEYNLPVQAIVIKSVKVNKY